MASVASLASETARKPKEGAEVVVSMMPIPRCALSAKAKETAAVEVLRRMVAAAEEEEEGEGEGANEEEKTKRNPKGAREPVARTWVELPLAFRATSSAPALASHCPRSSFYWLRG